MNARLPWIAVYRSRKYLPEQIVDDSDVENVVRVLDSILSCRGIAEFDVMTDQIDVRLNGRKIAVYMIGA